MAEIPGADMPPAGSAECRSDHLRESSDISEPRPGSLLNVPHADSEAARQHDATVVLCKLSMGERKAGAYRAVDTGKGGGGCTLRTLVCLVCSAQKDKKCQAAGDREAH